MNREIAKRLVKISENLEQINMTKRNINAYIRFSSSILKETFDELLKFKKAVKAKKSLESLNSLNEDIYYMLAKACAKLKNIA